MRVRLDVTAASTQGAGVGRYVRELALALHRLPQGPHLELHHHGRRPPRLPVELSSCRLVTVPVPERAWRAAALALGGRRGRSRRRGGGIDVSHGTDVVAVPGGRATVITIQDLTALQHPQHHTRLNGGYLRRALPAMAARADAVIVPSAATRRAVLEHLAVAPDAVHHVPLGVDHDRFHPGDRELAARRVHAALGVQAPYGLVVGTVEPRKDLLTIVRAWRQVHPPIRLVVAGARGWGDVDVAATAERLGLGERIRLVGRVEDEVLVDLYRAAGVLVQLSVAEGFGLPPLEAMACGTPVVVAERSSLPEVVGDAALTVPVDDLGCVASAISSVVGGGAIRDRLVDSGIRRAKAFTWARTAEETASVYVAALSRADGAAA